MTGLCLGGPGLEETARAVREAMRRGMMLVFAGRCWVEYEGRGASRSSPGDRLVVVKPSGSVLVHGPRGFKPENWQPDGSILHVSVDGGMLRVRAVRRRPREVLLVSCDSVHMVAAWLPVEEGSFVMYLSEEEIRDAIRRDPSIIGEGYKVIDVEKPVEAGFVDLFMQGPDGGLVVVELKRIRAGEAAVRQLSQYLEALAKRGVRARGVLAAPGFTDAALREARARGIGLVYLDLKRLRGLVESRRRPASLEDFLG